MKAAMNGVPNVSILDGWWPEACVDGVNGFAVGRGEPGDDVRDLHELYDTFEKRVIPAFTDRKKWARIMAESVRSTQDAFSCERMLREYFVQLYGLPDALPAPNTPVGA
jgi:starch phosphorylase